MNVVVVTGLKGVAHRLNITSTPGHATKGDIVVIEELGVSLVML